MLAARARVRSASSTWKEYYPFLTRGRTAPQLLLALRADSIMHPEAAAFTFSSVFATRGDLLHWSKRTICHSYCGNPRTAESSVSLRSRIGATPRCSLTDEQRADIFQRSPYHDYRGRRYGVPSSENKDVPESSQMRASTEETIDMEKGNVPSPVESTLAEEVSDGKEDGSGVDQKESVHQTPFTAESTATVGRRQSEARLAVTEETMPTAGEQTQFDEVYITKSVSIREERNIRRESVTSRRSTTDTGKEESVEETFPVASGLNFSSHDQLLKAFYAITGDPLEKDGGRIVVYRGNPKARLMIIGEAPGEQEDLEGKPFVGKAGQLLDKIFQYGGFDMEEQVYITNIAKRRPANNRTPTLEEVEYYLPYLHEEIRLIDPTIIVLAGRVASQALLGPEIRITKIRGQWFRYGENGPPMMPVFHPAYLLRRPVAKYDMVTDIEEIRTKYMELVPEDELKPLKKVS